MISFEEFMNLDNDKKWKLFIEICNKASGHNLKAGQRKKFLENLSIEDYNRHESYYREDFDFKNEYDKIVKLNEIFDIDKRKEKDNSIKVTDYKGKEFKGKWNQKFYNSQLVVDGTYRIYIDNECIHITEEEKERLIKECSNSKIDEDNKRTEIVLKEFEKMDDNVRQKLVEHLIYFYDIKIN